MHSAHGASKQCLHQCQILIYCGRNEADVGRGIEKSGIKREEVFIVTKVFNDCHGYELTTKTVMDSLSK
jgi:diketogulonate reductase-like aldo/keto reductase